MQLKPITRILVAVGMASAVLAQAHTLSLSNITAQWYDGTPAANISYSANNTAAPSARWGVPPVGGQASGYDFVVASQPINFSVPPSPSPSQSIGQFTQLNFPINDGTEITSVKLSLTGDVLVDGLSVGVRTFNYGFTHLETVNTDEPCADGGANGVGVNVNGCADSSTVSWLPASEDFLVGGEIFTLNVLGFSQDVAGTHPLDTFWTAENQSSSAYLQAYVALRNNVPEPGTLPLIGLGLAGLVVARRNRLCAARCVR